MDPSTEHVTRHRPQPATADEETWWDRYSANLIASPLSPTARQVIEADSHYIVEKGIFGAGLPGDPRWTEGRVRRGLVMGSVQSGKTASMLGVAALALDSHADILIVLAGTRVTLWRQTFDRLCSQLDRLPSPAEVEPLGGRLLIPDPELVSDDSAEVGPTDLYGISGPLARRLVQQKRPILAVVMKNVHHLRAMSEVIHDRLIPAVESLDRPFHLLVLDDEADDGSILDARKEATLDPSLADLKQIPRAIVDLWAKRPHVGTTASHNLYATYVGYTATPQANFLQVDHNPLAPSEFVISLRTPYDHGDLAHRSATYQEPYGVRAYYTGGDAFYERLRSALVVPTSGIPAEDMASALRAFLVSCAIQRWRAQDRLSLPEAAEARFGTREAAASACPEPMSMLLHPSSAVADQFDAAAQMLAATCGIDAGSAKEHVDSGDRHLPIEPFVDSLGDDEDVWLAWLSSYRASAHDLEAEFSPALPPTVPSDAEWPAIRAILVADVIPGVRFKVINSDPRADDRPIFGPINLGPGVWAAAPDLATIFVSGNVMSRGLTLEGLTTTLFLRSTDNPYADTQMQMQRWFGYRGSHLELCRVMLPQPQSDLFRAYHDADEALRRAVIAAMVDPGPAPSPTVLQGVDFSATGKLTNVSNVPLCPSAFPFVRAVNSGDVPDPNAALVAHNFQARESVDLVARGILRGRILSDPLPLLDAADLLDELRYDSFRPSPDGWEGRRWIDLEAHVGLSATTPGSLAPFFRPPPEGSAPAQALEDGGPYAIAAYFRLWNACLTHRATGLVGTDDPRQPWTLVDLTEKQAQQPSFYVGIRYGSGLAASGAGFEDLPFRIAMMQRRVEGDELAGTWGSRNPGEGPDHYLGDQLFDYHHHGRPAPQASSGEALWRPPGDPGLILFHVVQRENRAHPVIAVGIGIPLGGPDQFAARSASPVGGAT